MLSLAVFFCSALFAQQESLFKENEDNLIKNYRGKAHFIASSGGYMSAAEYFPINSNFFKNLLNVDSFPNVEPLEGYHLGSLTFMRNRLFYGASYSYTINNEAKTQKLKSKLNQSSLAIKFGYNLITTKSVALSPYLGLRYFRFRSKISPRDRKIKLEEYMGEPNIDLRIMQYAATAGTNLTVFIDKTWSASIYGAFIQKMHQYPVIKSASNRINDKISSPIGDFVIGLSFGMGFNDFY